ncbi:hypothetical protein AKJ51_01980 [candidate division MSBL1 archaeon SCGC-AAA382A20]|uniref:CARDB domain-containing protein n=1 Tax=candidate division MSBL1 archaeon SCGC-AAA382A20 TaxID=1698280 RepID=A0A133VKY4_9EURY|nr:hypothetical protein AKJ51_01980 [candidate division MSBL1 archaeon SCGC-AAA382A20]
MRKRFDLVFEESLGVFEVIESYYWIMHRLLMGSLSCRLFSITICLKISILKNRRKMQKNFGIFSSFSLIFLILIIFEVAIFSTIIFHISGQKSHVESPEFKTSTAKESPITLEQGDSFWFTLNVSNFGGAKGTKRLSLKIDGEVISNKKVNLNPNEIKPISFDISSLDMGEHKLEVGDFSRSLKVVSEFDCPNSEVTFEVFEEAGRVSLIHDGGKAIKKAINELGNWENLVVYRNGQPIEKITGIVGDGDTDFEPGEKIEIDIDNLSIGDKILALHSETENILEKTTISDDSEFVRVKFENLPHGIPKPPQKVSHYLKNTLRSFEKRDVRISFKVSSSWISSTGVDENCIVLQGYDPETGSWRPLSTSRIKSNDFLYLKSFSRGYQYFAVTGNKKAKGFFLLSENFLWFITLIAISVILIEVKVMWSWLDDRGDVVDISPCSKLGDKDMERAKAFEKVVNEFLDSGKKRAMLKTNRSSNEVLNYVETTIENMGKQDKVRAEVFEDEVHLVRKSEVV